MSKYIIISGVDGSGKTSIIEGVISALEAEGKTVSYIWMRYNNKLLTIMHAIAKFTGLSKKEETAMGKMWIHYFYKSKLFCWFYIRCSYIDNWFARKKPMKFSTDYVVCDRWINDIVVDLASETHLANLIETKWYGRFQELLPLECKQFVIVRSKKEVLKCRVENSFNPAFEMRYELYQQLSTLPNIVKIDNTGYIEDSIKQVLKCI